MGAHAWAQRLAHPCGAAAMLVFCLPEKQHGTLPCRISSVLVSSAAFFAVAFEDAGTTGASALPTKETSHFACLNHRKLQCRPWEQ